MGTTDPAALVGPKVTDRLARRTTPLVQDSSRPVSQPGGWPYERSTT
ncbi:hypothetical protein [Streptomyces sp. CS113]|nr:hypothetical protein [Streptomyces sp. CS113]